MRADADALVIGAGPAGTSTAILLADAGWRVILIEQHRYPRQKVCGECISAGGLVLLDRLGVGPAVQQLAGPELRQVGWMSGCRTIIADMPSCIDGPYRYGRALGRDRLDELLLQRATALGVRVLQPAKVLTVCGLPGRFECTVELLSVRAAHDTDEPDRQTLRTSVVVDAHGSWERGPTIPVNGFSASRRAPRRNSDLLGFKAIFQNAQLSPGFLPVLAFGGGYGGMVVSDNGRTTIACCLRRDALQACRDLAAGESAGVAIEAHLRRSCCKIGDVLESAQREGPWLSVGPLRPGIRVEAAGGVLRVGNAAGETHPLIGEGISMALQSASLLVHQLTRGSSGMFDVRRSVEVQTAYATAWRRAFAPRLRLAAAYAHLAMTPALTGPTSALLDRIPNALTWAARLASKARRAHINTHLPRS